jgi:DNA-binding NarL/FixJ family response regulator
VNATRRTQILDAYTRHARRFDQIAARRRSAVRGGQSSDSSIEPGPESDVERLSERQLEVLTLLADGLSNQEICVQLDVKLETVKSHVLHILQRLSARSRAHAVSIGYKSGFLA